MAPTGAEHPLLYVLGEAPGENEDVQAQQFVGDSGKRIRALIPKELLRRTRWDNVVRTRPPKNRRPLPEEVEFYRASVAADIAKSKPRAVLCAGALAANWALGSIGSITLLRGRKFPVWIAPHRCWFYPVHHPAYILRVENQRKVDDVPGEEWRRVWERDVERACTAALEETAPPYVQPDDEIVLLEGMQLAEGWTVERISKALQAFHGKDCAFDLETTKLRPYEKGARIATASVSAEGRTLAFPWSDSLKEAFTAWLLSPGAKIAFNLAFEQEWIAVMLGAQLLHQVKQWEDVEAQAYVLDEREGGHSLDFVAFEFFGLKLKSKSNINRKNIAGESMGPLLRYNALDSKFTLRAWHEGNRRLKAEGLEGIYRVQMRRIATAVLTQIRGLAVDVACVERLQTELAAETKALQRTAGELAAVQQFRKRHGKFNPGSPQDVLRVLCDLGFKSQLSARDKLSTDDALLSKIDHPVARAVLAIRKVQKLKGTYVDRLHPANAKSYVYPDGRIHPQFKTLKTDTGRWSSAGPNAQNFPKRKNAEIRAQVVADRGCMLLACDYKQLEATVIGALSGEHKIVESDIHLRWAERVAKLHPPIYKKRGSDIKAFRSDIKNQLVFPLFYGTSAGHVGSMLELPRRTADQVYEEFWDDFPLVRKWQRRLQSDYQELGYVEGPCGRRRRAPLSPNQVINTPVQGAASDLVVDAMDRMSAYAYEEDTPRLQPVLNIHDDITVCVPKKWLDDYVELVVEHTTTTQYSWMTLPLQVELSSGPNWYEMKELGKFGGKA